MKNFYSLPAGTVFKADILNIQPGRVTIRLDDGGKFTARSMVSPDARIGEESYFRVKVNNLDGLIQLEMIKGTPEERQDNLAQEALSSAGMYSTAENVELARALIENGLPVDPDTLQKAAHLRQTQPEAANMMLNSTFNEQLSKKVQYFQIGPGELFVYPGGSAVIALDTESFGRIEVQVSGEGEHINLQISAATDEAIQSLRKDSPRITKALQEKGYKMPMLTYKKLSNRTTVLTPSPADPGSNSETAATADNRRYSFDMRV